MFKDIKDLQDFAIMGINPLKQLFNAIEINSFLFICSSLDLRRCIPLRRTLCRAILISFSRRGKTAIILIQAGKSVTIHGRVRQHIV